MKTTEHVPDALTLVGPEALLFETPTLSEYISARDIDSVIPRFGDYVEYVRKILGYGKEELFERACISSSYGHEIIKGRKHPTRNKALQFALAMRVTLDETEKLLWIARHAALHRFFVWDAVIMEAIERRMTVTKANLMLFERGLPLLYDSK